MSDQFIESVNRRTLRAQTETRPNLTPPDLREGFRRAVVVSRNARGLYTVDLVGAGGLRTSRIQHVDTYPEEVDYNEDDRVLVFRDGSGQWSIFNAGGGGCSHGLTAFGVVTD